MHSKSKSRYAMNKIRVSNTLKNYEFIKIDAENLKKYEETNSLVGPNHPTRFPCSS